MRPDRRWTCSGVLGGGVSVKKLRRPETEIGSFSGLKIPIASLQDYILGEAAEAVGMEVHPAKASEVDAIVAKKLWAEQLLKDCCWLTVNRWYWVRPPRSRLQFTPRSPGARRLAKHGIQFPTPRLDLKA